MEKKEFFPFYEMLQKVIHIEVTSWMGFGDRLIEGIHFLPLLSRVLLIETIEWTIRAFGV